MGFIQDLARQNTRDILNGGFSTELTITPIGLEPVTINGLITKHSQTFDTDGLPAVGNNIHCSFSELDLNDLGIATRDLNGVLKIKGWKVSFTDAIQSGEYKFGETMPDNTLGLIKVMLSVI